MHYYSESIFMLVLLVIRVHLFNLHMSLCVYLYKYCKLNIRKIKLSSKCPSDFRYVYFSLFFPVSRTLYKNRFVFIQPRKKHFHYGTAFKAKKSKKNTPNTHKIAHNSPEIELKYFLTWINQINNVGDTDAVEPIVSSQLLSISLKIQLKGSCIRTQTIFKWQILTMPKD